jgi:hypothetical protein
VSNNRAYIHELVDIRGLHRANYMHHMTANWSPTAQEDRNQLCFGVWAVVGSTGKWPQVCNIWEMESLQGLADQLTLETGGSGAYDPVLERWWAEAYKFRTGGTDRILTPAPWMPTITETLDEGTRAEVCAHETLRCAPGTASDVLELAATRATEAYRHYGWRLTGAWSTAMRDDDEVILLWSVPDYRSWAEAEATQRTDTNLVAWRREARELVHDWQRILLSAAPLCPLRTGRQPTREDQTDWTEEPKAEDEDQ